MFEKSYLSDCATVGMKWYFWTISDELVLKACKWKSRRISILKKQRKISVHAITLLCKKTISYSVPVNCQSFVWILPLGWKISTSTLHKGSQSADKKSSSDYRKSTTKNRRGKQSVEKVYPQDITHFVL